MPARAAGVARLVWNWLAYVHPDELPFATADSSNFSSTYKNDATASGHWTPPLLDRWVILPMVHALPKRARNSILSESSFKDVARVFDPEASIPGLPDWECIPTPGHVSFIRPGDRVLITGNALVTVNLNSLWGVLLWGFRRNKQGFSGPPWYTTWSWQAAKQSIASISRVKPLVPATGHGLPMTGPTTARDVRAFADRVR
jgi:hypothetical protein